MGFAGSEVWTTSKSDTMAPWSSLTGSRHSLRAPWSSLLLPLLFLLLLAPHTSRPQDIEDFKCWNAFFSPDSEATIIYPYNLKNDLKGDIKNEIGSQHEIFCRFNSSIFNAQDIYFEIKNRSKDFDERLPHKIVNDSTIMAMLPSDYSFDGQIRCKKEEQDQYLCFRDLRIGYEPQDVENFTCISDNWETLNCTWDVPNNPLKVDYTLTYVVPRFMNRTDCPQDKIRKSSKKRNWCFWSMTTQPQFVSERQHMIFTIHGENDIGSHSFERDIDIYKVVRPKPPVEFKTNVTGPYSVTIEWMLPYPMSIFPGNVRYEISTRLSSSENDNDLHDNNKWTVLAKELITIDTHKTDSSLHSVPLQLEYANTDYDIRMRFHTGTGSIREHMWSTPMIKPIRTLSTKPTVTPRTIQGMFEVHNSLDKRDIFVFWQKIDPMLKNGDGFKYIVEAYDESDKKVKDKHEESSFVKFENLKFHNSYRFAITSSNENGTAGNHSEVHVPRKTAVQNNSKTFNVIAREAKPAGTVHSVSWSFEDGEQVESITIFWCKKSGYDYRCNNKMEWQTINWSEMFTKEKNLTLENGTQYAFGRAVTSNQESSGIVWIRCVASSGNEPPKVDRLDVNELSATSVTLNWEMGCGDKAAIPIGVNISYCEIPKSEIEQNNQEDACKQGNKTYYSEITKGLTAKIEDLHPFTKYRFSIAVLTKVGQGKWSDAKIVDTETATPSGPPVDFNIYERGSTWVMFKWKPPLEMLQNGMIKKFELITEPCDVPTEEIIYKDRISPFIEYNITGLQSYTNYTFKLAACTIKGCGRTEATKAVRSGYTKTGVPGNVRDIYLDASNGQVSFELDDEKAWKKQFELRYTINDTVPKMLDPSENEVLQIPEWQETCVEDTKVVVEVRVINIGDDGENNTGSWKESKPTTCQLTGSEINASISFNSHQNQIKIQMILGNSGKKQFGLLLNSLLRGIKPILDVLDESIPKSSSVNSKDITRSQIETHNVETDLHRFLQTDSQTTHTDSNNLPPSSPIHHLGKVGNFNGVPPSTVQVLENINTTDQKSHDENILKSSTPSSNLFDFVNFSDNMYEGQVLSTSVSSDRADSSPSVSDKPLFNIVKQPIFPTYPGINPILGSHIPITGFALPPQIISVPSYVPVFPYYPYTGLLRYDPQFHNMNLYTPNIPNGNTFTPEIRPLLSVSSNVADRNQDYSCPLLQLLKLNGYRMRFSKSDNDFEVNIQRNKRQGLNRGHENRNGEGLYRTDKSLQNDLNADMEGIFSVNSLISKADDNFGTSQNFELNRFINQRNLKLSQGENIDRKGLESFKIDSSLKQSMNGRDNLGHSQSSTLTPQSMTSTRLPFDISNEDSRVQSLEFTTQQSLLRITNQSNPERVM